MSAFCNLPELEPIRIWEGIAGRVIGSAQLTMAVVELDADAVIPEHSHANEQVGILVAGTLTFRIGDEERSLRPGGGWAISPHVPHEVRVGPQRAVVIETFAPPRDDWDALERLSLVDPHWP